MYEKVKLNLEVSDDQTMLVAIHEVEQHRPVNRFERGSANGTEKTSFVN